MNKSYKSVWNSKTGAWVAVSEVARAKGKRSGAVAVALAPAILALLAGGAQAQNVTLSGTNGELGGDTCNSVYVPSECATETLAVLAPVNAATFTHTAGPRPGVLIGANLSNTNTGPAVSGSASVTGGGVASTGRVWVGFEANTTGSLSISGAGSRWTAGGIGVIGLFGTGSLTVSDGGLFQNSNSYVGFGSSGVGNVLVTGIAANGTRSRWASNNNTLYLGGGFVGPVSRPGGNGTVTVEDGGLITTVAGGVRVGQAVGGVGVLNVRGVHANGVASSVTTTGETYVGNFGTGTMNVENGGTVTNTSGAIGGGTLMADTSPTNVITIVTPTMGVGTVNVTGVNGASRSTWTNNGLLGVGNYGTGTLNILNGGLVTSTGGSIGNMAGAVGTATVSGVNGANRSTWTSTGSLSIGNSGTGTLVVENGGRVSAGGVLEVGQGTGGNGTLTVTGSGSSLSSDSVVVGAFGTGAMVISNGGVLNTVGVGGGAGVGGYSPASRGTVTVTGAGSAWNNVSTLLVGFYGSGALTVSEGGRVSAAAGAVGFSADGEGVINIGAAPGASAVAPGLLDMPGLVFGAGTGALNFNHTNNAGYDFAVPLQFGAGTGTINQLAGNTNLTGDSSLFAGVTHVTGGTLRVNGTLGDATSQVNVSNGATLGGAGTIGGSVTVGDGVLSPGNSPGTLTIAGNLALSSGSQLNYELGAANTVGGPLNDLTVVGGNLTLDGTLNVTQSAGGTYGAGVYRLIDYSGSLTDNGLALGNMPAGTDNYVQTSIAQQVNLVNSKGLTLNWWDGDAGGKNDGAIAGGNGTWLAGPTGTDRWTQADGLINAPYQDAAFAIFAGAPGTVTVDNSLGQVRVSGMQFATNGYRIEGGNVELAGGTNAIRVGDGTAAGAGITATVASALTGTGRLDKVDLGTLVLTGANTYSGGTAISGGTLQLGDGGSSGSMVGDVANHGVLAFNRADGVNFAGAITGTGSVTQMGAGTTTLAAANTYSGGTTISAGTLAGSATSFGSGTITDNARLVIEQSTNATLANAINGTGSLVKTGAGELNLTGTSALAGATTVAQGTLSVNGSIANSAVTVVTGATLAGNGTVGATTVQGTVSPGNGTIGTLKVNGNFTQSAGSTYQVQVDPIAKTADRIAITGTASIAGGSTLAVSRTNAGRYTLGDKYTVLSAAGGVSGRYSLTGDTRTAFVQVVDTYDAQNVYLTAEQARTFQQAGVTPNQIATAGGLQSLANANPLRTAIAWLPDDAAARGAFDQLSGEVHASVQTALLDDSRFVREAANDRLLGAFCSPGASDQVRTQQTTAERDGGDCTPAAGVTAWGRVFASNGHFDGDGNATRLERNIGGFFVGADTALAGGWRAGGLAGYSRSGFHVDARGSSAKGDSYTLGAYGGNQWGNTSLRLGASYTWHKLDTHRGVNFAGYADSLSAKYDASTAQIFGEVGHRFDLGNNVTVEPFAGLAYVKVKTDGFQERGGYAALTGQGDDTDATFSTLGARFSAQVSDSTKLRAMLGWRHAFGSSVPTSTHSFAGSQAFTVGGVPLAKNVGVLEAGVETQLKPNLKLSVSYSGQFGNGVNDNGMKASLDWKF